MVEKRLKQFTFYDLYYEALKGLPGEAAGRMVENIYRFMFTNEEVPEPQDDRENFFWSNIKDVLEKVKRIEESGRKPKNFNEKMPHFTFIDTYGKALKLMTDVSPMLDLSVIPSNIMGMLVAALEKEITRIMEEGKAG